jgi:hypothetical protein
MLFDLKSLTGHFSLPWLSYTQMLSHHYNTRHKSHLHPPSVRLTWYQKVVHYMGVKVFNKHPPSKIQYLSSNKKQFHKALKNFLLLGWFYRIEEFYNWSSVVELHATWYIMIIPYCFVKVFKLCPPNPIYYKFYCNLFIDMSIVICDGL